MHYQKLQSEKWPCHGATMHPVSILSKTLIFSTITDYYVNVYYFQLNLVSNAFPANMSKLIKFVAAILDPD